MEQIDIINVIVVFCLVFTGHLVTFTFHSFNKKNVKFMRIYWLFALLSFIFESNFIYLNIRNSKLFGSLQ